MPFLYLEEGHHAIFTELIACGEVDSCSSGWGFISAYFERVRDMSKRCSHDFKDYVVRMVGEQLEMVCSLTSVEQIKSMSQCARFA